MRASDSRHFDVDLRANRHALVEAAVEQAAIEPSCLASAVEIQARGKPCYHYPTYATNLVVRATARYLSQRFRVTAPNRDRVVRSVIEALSEATPFHVIRRDIRGFYENIPISELRDRLLYDTGLPKQVRRHLREYFDILGPQKSRGLPRGIGLTTILAELAMHQFDQQVRSIPGVYRYFRYSDDILVFCFGDRTETANSIDAALPAEMSFNDKKAACVSFFDTKQAAKTVSFDYLGYCFRCSDHAPKKKGKPRPVHVSIAPIKIDRLKTRIILSLKDYQRTKDETLLLYRMRYLSGNYRVSRSPAFFQLRSNYTRSGIYFNYKRCGIHLGSNHAPSPRRELMSLDWFYHHILRSPKSSYSTSVWPTLSQASRDELQKISFNKGFSDTIFARVPAGVTTTVKSIWNRQA